MVSYSGCVNTSDLELERLLKKKAFDNFRSPVEPSIKLRMEPKVRMRKLSSLCNLPSLMVGLTLGAFLATVLSVSFILLQALSTTSVAILLLLSSSSELLESHTLIVNFLTRTLRVGVLWQL